MVYGSQNMTQSNINALLEQVMCSVHAASVSGHTEGIKILSASLCRHMFMLGFSF